MEYPIDKQALLDKINAWDGFLKKRVHLIACGGTALTLLGIKSSTKDIDLIVPDTTEYDYLIGILKRLGYKSASGWGWQRGDGFIFDLFRGKTVHTTELSVSPLEEGNHTLIKEFSHIYTFAARKPHPKGVRMNNGRSVFRFGKPRASARGASFGST